MENFSCPVEPASTAPLADPVVSTEPTNAPRTPDEDENVEGMALNPHWVANGGKQPDNWRHFSALIKYHRTDMKCFEFDVVNGGKVRCVACCSFPVLADKSAKLFREEGYFGQKNGYKWEFFKAHLNSKDHKLRVSSADSKSLQPKVRKVILDVNAYTEKGKIARLNFHEDCVRG